MSDAMATMGAILQGTLGTVPGVDEEARATVLAALRTEVGNRHPDELKVTWRLLPSMILKIAGWRNGIMILA